MCVLTLHRVLEVPERPHDVSWSSFRRVLNNIDRVTTELELGDVARRSVVITLDDGTDDHAEVGGFLGERGLPAIFFVPPIALGRQGFLTGEQLGELRQQGHEVGSHGLNNVRFENLTAAQLRREVRTSKERLQDVIQSDVRYLAPPGGSSHPLLVTELRRSGYTAARSVRWGIYASDTQRWRIPSIPVTEFTVSRGWVDRALATWQLPRTMALVWSAKESLPEPARATMRAWSHRRTHRRR